MQLSNNFPCLAIFILALASVGTSTPLAALSENDDATVSAGEIATYLMSYDEMMAWLKTTDAELTFIGAPFNPLASRSAQTTTVTYCNKRVDSVCGGSCTVYQGGATCINAPGTNCLAATNNVGFCNHSGCSHSCNELSDCGTRLDNGFCYTPGTESILVSAA